MSFDRANNTTRLSIIKNFIMAAIGLFMFGVGVYFTIQANIGVAPWDAFNLGLSKTFGIKYGNASVVVSLIILIIDLLLKEKIGLGMILDAFVVGKTVDLLNWFNLLPSIQNMWLGIVVMLIGFTIMGFSQYIYMKAGLCCGPRDSLLVALKKRLKRVPIGVISIIILIIVVFIGWRLGGPIGLGTLIAVCCTGPIMQWTFSVVKFKPENMVHQDLAQSCKILLGKN